MLNDDIGNQRTCPKCGKMNYYKLEHCHFCQAIITDAPVAPAPEECKYSIIGFYMFLGGGAFFMLLIGLQAFWQCVHPLCFLSIIIPILGYVTFKYRTPHDKQRMYISQTRRCYEETLYDTYLSQVPDQPLTISAPYDSSFSDITKEGSYYIWKEDEVLKLLYIYDKSNPYFSSKFEKYCKIIKIPVDHIISYEQTGELVTRTYTGGKADDPVMGAIVGASVGGAEGAIIGSALAEQRRNQTHTYTVDLRCIEVKLTDGYMKFNYKNYPVLEELIPEKNINNYQASKPVKDQKEIDQLLDEIHEGTQKIHECLSGAFQWNNQDNSNQDTDISQALTALETLKAQGLLTEEEFLCKKTKLLKGT